MKIFLVIIIALIFVGSAYSKKPIWFTKIQNIKPLITTKSEIEKLFPDLKVIKSENLSKKFKRGWGERIEYEVNEGSLEIEYSTGNCSVSKSRYGYDAEKDIVVGLVFFPAEITFDNELKFDLNQFRQITHSETPDFYELESEKLGITVSIYQAKVHYINLYISEEGEKFVCQNVPEIREPDWLVKLRKLEIFKSTRSEVEKLFNNPKITDIYDNARKEKNGWGVEVEYETEYGNLEVEYSSGNCKESQSKYGYDIAKNVISGFSFYPNNPIDFTEFNFNLKEFDSESVRDVYGAYIHTNNKLGVRINLVEGKIEYIEFYLDENQKNLIAVRF